MSASSSVEQAARSSRASRPVLVRRPRQPRSGSMHRQARRGCRLVVAGAAHQPIVGAASDQAIRSLRRQLRRRHSRGSQRKSRPGGRDRPLRVAGSGSPATFSRSAPGPPRTTTRWALPVNRSSPRRDILPWCRAEFLSTRCPRTRSAATELRCLSPQSRPRPRQDQWHHDGFLTTPHSCFENHAVPAVPQAAGQASRRERAPDQVRGCPARGVRPGGGTDRAYTSNPGERCRLDPGPGDAPRSEVEDMVASGTHKVQAVQPVPGLESGRGTRGRRW